MTVVEYLKDHIFQSLLQLFDEVVTLAKLLRQVGQLAQEASHEPTSEEPIANLQTKCLWQALAIFVVEHFHHLEPGTFGIGVCFRVCSKGVQNRSLSMGKIFNPPVGALDGLTLLWGYFVEQKRWPPLAASSALLPLGQTYGCCWTFTRPGDHDCWVGQLLARVEHEYIRPLIQMKLVVYPALFLGFRLPNGKLIVFGCLWWVCLGGNSPAHR